MTALVWSLIKNPLARQQEKVIDRLMIQNSELLNRLQAPDLKTFLALQSDLRQVPDSAYVPMDDESEAARLPKLQPQQGFGEVLTYEDVHSYALKDFDNYANFADESK